MNLLKIKPAKSLFNFGVMTPGLKKQEKGQFPGWGAPIAIPSHKKPRTPIPKGWKRYKIEVEDEKD
jgi:hypothetical protein